MARQTGNSMLGSLRGKIWISTGVLAFFICTFGLISYLVVSLLVKDSFAGIFIPFLLLAFTVMIFGWWLSNEIVSPVENVTLLAKSMERSTSTSIPRTSGSAETDQLLQTIQRNNQQIQKIVTLMEKVATGNVDIQPLQGTDRLSTSFQKLLARVSESINAKEELDELKAAVGELKLDVSGVRSGNLDVVVKSESPHTKELADTFRYLIDNLTRLIGSIQNSTTSTEFAIKAVEEDLQQVIQRDETRVQELQQASIALKQVPNLINKITEDLISSAKSARTTIEKARHGYQVASDNSKTVSTLRKQVREDVKRIQNLTERSHDIERVAKTVEDLANRTNMIALNASIQATELGEEGHGFVLVAEEVERLAARANGTNKQISTLNKAILAEISKVETAAESTMAEVANLSKFAIDTSNVLGEMQRYVNQFLTLQENLIAYSKDQSEETDEAFGIFVGSIDESENTVATLKDSGARLGALLRVTKDLKSLVGEFRLGGREIETAEAKSEGEILPRKANSDMEPDEFPAEFRNASAGSTAEFEAADAPSHFENGEYQGDPQAEAKLPVYDQFASDESGGFDYSEYDFDTPLDTEDSREEGFTSEEYALAYREETADSSNNHPESVSGEPAEPQFDESSDISSAETELDDNEVFDLYKASLAAGPSTENEPEPEAAIADSYRETYGEEYSAAYPQQAEETFLEADGDSEAFDNGLDSSPVFASSTPFESVDSQLFDLDDNSDNFEVDLLDGDSDLDLQPNPSQDNEFNLSV
ncbi:MAG: methyl-accepting chemotaxis protein [Pyrinomonadaceae bacterium]